MNNPVLVEQPGKDCLKIIPPKWDLIYVEAKSHLGGINQFSCKRFVFTKWNIPFCRDLTQVRRLTWVEWLIVLIQRLFFSASSPRCKTSRETEVAPFPLPLFMEVTSAPRVFAKFQLIKYTADSLLQRYSANCELSKWIHYGKGYTLIFLLQNLGILINFEKSVLQPCQRTEFWGIVVDSIDNTLTLSQEKVNTITDLWQCKKLLNWLGN